MSLAEKSATLRVEPTSGTIRARPVRESTRYLCAAAYTDRGFRDAVLNRKREKIRARPPEIGIDLDAVTGHCESAHRSITLRDAIICIISLIAIGFTLVGLSGDDVASTQLPILICWLAVAFIVTLRSVRVERIIREQLTRQAYDERIQASADTNVVVYSGFSPFVGAGLDLGGWSFAIDLERGPQNNAGGPIPFGLPEIYDHIAAIFHKLRIPHLRIGRKVFISGRCVRTEKQILPDIHGPPMDTLPEKVVAEYAENRSRHVRHYLCIESVDWDGELAVNLFLRFHKISCKLFVEVSMFLLPPLKESYYNIDKVHPKLRFRDRVAITLQSLIVAPFLMILAPFFSLARLQGRLGRPGQDRQQYARIENDLLFDYGAEKSIREYATGKEWRVYFQKLDKEMHLKIMQQQLLDGLVDFLDKHNIDTSEIKERTTHILNQGLIVSGGTVNAQGLAVGKQAQVMMENQIKQKAPS